MKVLIVEDNEVDVMMETRILGGISDHIDSCATCEDALEKISNNDYDCIILDYLLPGSDGLQSIAEIRKIDRNTPIIVVTGVDDKLVATRCIQEGAQNYFPKDKITQEKKLFMDCVIHTTNLHALECSARIDLLKAKTKEIEKRLDAVLL